MSLVSGVGASSARPWPRLYDLDVFPECQTTLVLRVARLRRVCEEYIRLGRARWRAGEVSLLSRVLVVHSDDSMAFG